jgi:hypothetical protein
VDGCSLETQCSDPCFVRKHFAVMKGRFCPGTFVGPLPSLTVVVWIRRFFESAARFLVVRSRLWSCGGKLNCNTIVQRFRGTQLPVLLHLVGVILLRLSRVILKTSKCEKDTLELESHLIAHQSADIQTSKCLRNTFGLERMYAASAGMDSQTVAYAQSY